MSELSTRIQRVTEDLRAIQAELDAAAQPSATSTDRERIMDELLQLNLMGEFKAAVDHMRLLLWSYIEASSAHNPNSVERTLQSVRLQRVTEMLKILQPGMQEASMATAPEAQSFFDVIHKIAHSTMDRHDKTEGDS